MNVMRACRRSGPHLRVLRKLGTKSIDIAGHCRKHMSLACHGHQAGLFSLDQVHIVAHDLVIGVHDAREGGGYRDAARKLMCLAQHRAPEAHDTKGHAHEGRICHVIGICCRRIFTCNIEARRNFLSDKSTHDMRG